MDLLRPDEKRRWISSQQIFDDLPAEALESLMPSFHLRTFPAHTLVMLELQSSNAVSLIVRGTVKVCLARRGRETLLNICGPGEVLGEISLLDGKGHSADIETLEETSLFWIERDLISGYLDKYPQFGINLAKILSRRVRLATSRIEALTTLDVPGRVAHQILAFAKEYGQDQDRGRVLLPLCLTQSDLAALVGASRPRVNQALSMLKRSKIIDIGKNQHITIIDKEALTRRSVEAIAAPAL